MTQTTAHCLTQALTMFCSEPMTACQLQVALRAENQDLRAKSGCSTSFRCFSTALPGRTTRTA